MDSFETYARLNRIFRDVFDDESIVVSSDTTAADVTGWDSFAHINLTLAIERVFGVRFTGGDIERMNCVGDIVSIIDRRTGNRT